MSGSIVMGGTLYANDFNQKCLAEITQAFTFDAKKKIADINSHLDFPLDAK